jgi:hypothetical protein
MVLFSPEAAEDPAALLPVGVPLDISFGCDPGSITAEEDGTMLIDGSVLEGGGQV